MLTRDDRSSAERLLADVHDFVSETGMSETRLLTEAGVEKSTLRWMREKKRSITLETHDKIRRAMARHGAGATPGPTPEQEARSAAGATGTLRNEEESQR